ncbi:MAG TPA: hypothetical protein VKD89_03250 [Candidatus Udaeobacter sp.]|nr:hypothetical protein [Candidatus Udaeobacter sp.]
MASEPKKPIEQMLEALAKARRAEFGDDPQMPNPMRARLHEEITRMGATNDERVEPRPSWVTRFWPRVTVAAALATLMVLVPAILWNRSHPVAESGDLALRDRAAVAADELNRAVAAENTLAKAPAVGATETTVNLADKSQIKSEPAATPASEAEALKSVTTGFNDREIASAKSLAAPAAGRDSKAESDRLARAAPPAQPPSAGSLGTRQQFSQQSAVQSFRNNAQLSRAANVLNTFQVQQEGSEIRVLDADGSTYTGKIEQLAKSAELDSRITERRDAAKQTRRYAAKAAGETESPAPQSYFHASGYNVSLKKTLVFEGNYAAPQAQLPAKATSNDRERAESNRDRARIVGTVRVNGEAPVAVDAIAETPDAAGTKKSQK